MLTCPDTLGYPEKAPRVVQPCCICGTETPLVVVSRVLERTLPLCRRCFPAHGVTPPPAA
jgi:hypothetical protein